MGRALSGSAEMLHIATKSVLVEADSMSIVGGYAPDVENRYALQLAVNFTSLTLSLVALNAIDDSAGPDVLVPTHLVFGTLPMLGLSTNQPTPSIFERVVALWKATEAMSRQFAKRQVRDPMTARNGPVVTDIYNAGFRL